MEKGTLFILLVCLALYRLCSDPRILENAAFSTKYHLFFPELEILGTFYPQNVVSRAKFFVESKMSSTFTHY